MKSVLFLDQYRTLGGGQVVLVELMRTFVKEGWQVNAAFPLGGEFERRAREVSGVQFHDLPEVEMKPGKKGLADLFKLLAFSRHFLTLLPQIREADVVYLNGPRLFPLGFLLQTVKFPGVKSKTKFVYHIHLDHTRSQKKFLSRILRHRKTSLVVVNSEFTWQRLKEIDRVWEKSARVRLVPNALSGAYSQLSFRPPIRTGSELRFITVGRLSPEKGQGHVIDLAKRLPENKFFLVGAPDFSDRDFEDHLKRLAPPNVIFAGKATDVPKFIQENEISGAIVPSQVPESFGLVAIEAMAASCFAIVSDRGQLPMIAEKTGAWIFKNQGDLEKLIVQLIKTPAAEVELLIQSQFEATHSHFDAIHFEENVKTQILAELSR